MWHFFIENCQNRHKNMWHFFFVNCQNRHKNMWHFSIESFHNRPKNECDEWNLPPISETHAAAMSKLQSADSLQLKNHC